MGQKDPMPTGRFEVTILPEEKVIHSKNSGQGRCESDEERQALYEKIRQHLETMDN